MSNTVRKEGKEGKKDWMRWSSDLVTDSAKSSLAQHGTREQRFPIREGPGWRGNG